MYYKPETNQTFKTHSDVRSGLRNVIFSDVITDEDLAYNNVFPLAYDKPIVDAGKVAVPLTVENIDGEWTQLWDVRDMTEAEVEAAKPEVPASVTRRQARQALFLRGLLDQIPVKLAALPDGQKQMAQIEWEDSLEFKRDRPLVIQIGLALGLNSAGLDELFIFAATL
jgi:hypothetical protein